MPHIRQSPKKEMEILRQVTLLEEQGIINVQCKYYSQVILAPKPMNGDYVLISETSTMHHWKMVPILWH
jgi:hypothetical protein